MPYSGAGDDSLPEYVKKLNEGDRGRWVAIFNSAYKKCTGDGGDKAKCESSAFAQANGVVVKGGKRTMDIKELWGKVQEIFAPLVAENRAAYPWDQCIADQMKQYGNKATAEAVCGAIKAGRSLNEAGDILLPAGFDLATELRKIEKELGITPPTRARSIDTAQVYSAIRERFPYDQTHPENEISVQGVYVDGAAIYATLVKGGKLYRLDISADGKTVSLGELIETEANFQPKGTPMPQPRAILPTQTRALTITRTADGKARWLMIAASAVINKVGSIDSTLLFDSFIKRAAIEGYPRLDFFHEGDHISFGQADWLRRDGALYLASGAFDDTDLARAATVGLEKAPAYWGASIAYRSATEPMVIVSEGQIPVYTDGLNTFISIVPRNRAADLFTAVGVIEEVKRMDKSVYDELVKLVGEAAAAPFASEVDDANRTITETGMITRVEPTPEPTFAGLDEALTTAKTSVPAEPAPVPEPTPESAPIVERQDLAALEKAIAALTERVTKLEQSAGGAGQQVQDAEKRATDAMTGLTIRLDDMEKGYGQWKQWLDALPEAQRSEATYRPRDAHQADAAPMASADVAKQTMEKVNARHK